MASNSLPRKRKLPCSLKASGIYYSSAGFIMNRKVNVFLGLAVALMAAVSIFVLFSYAFNDSQGLNFDGASLFTAMFGNTSKELNAVPWLIVAFSFEVAAFVTGLLGGILQGKISALVYGVTLALLVAAGVLFLNSVNLYLAVNPYSGTDTLSLGTGAICTVVFAFIGALLSLYGAYSNWKA